MSRIFLSPPDVGDLERKFVLDALDSGWVAPVGPHVDAFEREVAELVGVAQGAALASGTAALHLALHILGVGAGDEVLTATLTFAASAFAIRYVGADPVFVDADPQTWQMDPELLARELEDRAVRGRLPKAVVTVDLYGQCSDYDRIRAICAPYDLPIVEDAAEALGATYRGRHAGSFGDLGVFSFNGNKIATTGGGGMLVSDHQEWIEEARFLASQARDEAIHYEHSRIGFNYRLSNISAAVGRAQLLTLESRIARRRARRDFYVEALGALPGIAFMPEAPYGQSNCWLTCLTIDPDAFGATRDDVVNQLGALDIEARPVWKPMHLQPVFSGCPSVGGDVAAGLFARGLCLPSGSNLTDEQAWQVAHAVRSVCGAGK